MTRPSPVAAVVLVSVLGVAAFLALGMAVVRGATNDFDTRVVNGLRDPLDAAQERGPRWLTGSARDITGLGSLVIMSGLSLSVLGFALLRGNLRLAALVLLAAGGGFAVSSGLKAVYDRPRPPLPQGAGISSRSFPSGHAMLSAAVYLSLAAVLATRERRTALRVYLLALSFLITLLVGATRVYLGYHYPTDVVAGWIAGVVWAVWCALATWASGEHS